MSVFWRIHQAATIYMTVDRVVTEPWFYNLQDGIGGVIERITGANGWKATETIVKGFPRIMISLVTIYELDCFPNHFHVSASLNTSRQTEGLCFWILQRIKLKIGMVCSKPPFLQAEALDLQPPASPLLLPLEALSLTSSRGTCPPAPHLPCFC